MIATAFGVALGPLGLDVLGLTAWGPPLHLLEGLARVTVALAVASIALRLPRGYFRRRARAMAALLGPVMLAMWLTSSILAYLLLPVPVWVAALVGAVVTPTDPVLATTIVKGGPAEANIPERLRYLLSAEAGVNDGAAYPFVFLGVLAVTGTGGPPLGEWLTGTVLWGVLGAVVLGFAVGAGVGRIERLLSRRRSLEETSVFTVALTLAVLGLFKLLGTDDVLAVFVAAFAYRMYADERDEAEERKVEEVFNRVVTLPVFVFFGTAIPWAGWIALGWRGPALVAAVLLFRRLPAVLALRPAIRPLNRPTATLFVGWFGPIGVAAVLYATLAARETGVDAVWTVASLVVAGSILVHGVTATLFTLRYGRLGDEADWW